MARRLGTCWIVLAVCLVPGVLGAQNFIRGDANGDGTLNIADSITILNFIYNGGVPPTPLDASDANDNGVVEISDSVYTFVYLFSGGPPPPAPFPGPGIDTTPPTFPAGPNGTLEFRLNSTSSCAGSQALLSIFVDNADPVEAMNHRIVCNPAEASLLSASSDPIALILGNAPDFFSVTSNGAGEMLIGTIPSFLSPTTSGLQPGVDQRVIDVVIDVAAFIPLGQVIAIEFGDDPAASPPQFNMASVGGGQVVLADLTQGSITASCMQAEYLRGDSNEDGAVSVSDAVFLVQFLFQSGPVSSCERTGDCNGDGFIDVADVVYLLNAYFAGGPGIMAPYPLCDLDPFASALSCTLYPASCP
jgi:hypothetical protein